MQFNDSGKIALFGFMSRITKEFSICTIYKRIFAMKQYKDFDEYFDNVVESMFSNNARNIDNIKSYRIQTDLAIVAGLYYGDDLSLEHLERDYQPNLSREALRQEVMTFTKHVLFGREASGVEQVGELRIEKEGLVPIMDTLIASGMPEEEQKIELMRYLTPYGIISERAMQAAREASMKNPDVVLAMNTNQNRNIENTPHCSFVEKIGGEQNANKSVRFSV